MAYVALSCVRTLDSVVLLDLVADKKGLKVSTIGNVMDCGIYLIVTYVQ